MAQRRMLSMHIIDTDAFMDMPHSTQSLYMHMLMRADDDGFVANAKKIMRMVGSQDDDLKILFNKRFILPFESGVCVIKHWRIHNLIRSDRYNETKWIEEKAQLILKDNGSYSMATTGIPDGNQRETQVRLGKVSKGKVSTQSVSDYSDEFLSFWNEYPKKVGKGEAFRAWRKANPPLSDVLEAIKAQRESDQWSKDNGRFIPNPATWLNQRRWEDEVTSINSKYSKYDN